MKKKFTLITLCLLLGNQAYAQMPVPLLDESTAKQTGLKTRWGVTSKLIVDALECKAILNPHDERLSAYLRESPAGSGTWLLSNVPEPLKVFGMPVVSTAFYIDESGELGASYTSVIEAPQPIVNKQAQIVKSNERSTAVGGLRTEHPQKTTNLICTVQGTQTE